MFYKNNPIYFIFWDTYICFQRIFRFKPFTYFYMYFLSTIWNDIDFHNWVYWCHLLVGWQKITCGLILLQEEAMSMSKPCQRWDSEIFSLEFTKNLTLSTGEKKGNHLWLQEQPWPDLSQHQLWQWPQIPGYHHLCWPILDSRHLSSHRKDTTGTLLLLHRECADMQYHCMVQGTWAVLKQRGAGFSRPSTQLRRLSGFHSPPFCLSRPRNILKESLHPGSHLFDPTIKWPPMS